MRHRAAVVASLILLAAQASAAVAPMESVGDEPTPIRTRSRLPPREPRPAPVQPAEVAPAPAPAPVQPPVVVAPPVVEPAPAPVAEPVPAPVEIVPVVEPAPFAGSVMAPGEVGLVSAPSGGLPDPSIGDGSTGAGFLAPASPVVAPGGAQAALPPASAAGAPAGATTTSAMELLNRALSQHPPELRIELAPTVYFALLVGAISEGNTALANELALYGRDAAALALSLNTNDQTAFAQMYLAMDSYVRGEGLIWGDMGFTKNGVYYKDANGNVAYMTYAQLQAVLAANRKAMEDVVKLPPPDVVKMLENEPPDTPDPGIDTDPALGDLNTPSDRDGSSDADAAAEAEAEMYAGAGIGPIGDQPADAGGGDAGTGTGDAGGTGSSSSDAGPGEGGGGDAGGSSGGDGGFGGGDGGGAGDSGGGDGGGDGDGGGGPRQWDETSSTEH